MKKRLILALAAALLVCGCAAAAGTLNTTVDSESEAVIAAFAEEHGLKLWQYPEDIVALYERNPETEEFVLNYPLEVGKYHSVDLSDYDFSDGVPLFLQWDSRWGYIRYGSNVAGLTACGPTCLSMAACYLTGSGDYSPDKLIEFALKNNYYVSGSGSKWTLISEGGEKLGFDVTELPLVKARIFDCLERGIPVICVMGPGDFTTSGHYIVMVGVEDGLIQINDPNSRANSEKLWDYDDICDQIRNLWSIENPDA